mmetsp:Transcript_2785/g.5528  ORF Transcript_2785/g.5528 Transcript_2785/m.5528 type:complete len:209 (+) Transcript_2785:1358-1984(+)
MRRLEAIHLPRLRILRGLVAGLVVAHVGRHLPVQLRRHLPGVGEREALGPRGSGWPRLRRHVARHLYVVDVGVVDLPPRLVALERVDVGLDLLREALHDRALLRLGHHVVGLDGEVHHRREELARHPVQDEVEVQRRRRDAEQDDPEDGRAHHLVRDPVEVPGERVPDSVDQQEQEVQEERDAEHDGRDGGPRDSDEHDAILHGEDEA